MALMMCINLYTSRVVLQALGVEDYGIYGVVGGVVAMLGFLNAYRKTNEERYLAAAEDVLNYILTKLTDPRDGSEWYWCLDENDKPVTEKPIVEPWKCPYHNGRMCMEIIKY